MPDWICTVFLGFFGLQVVSGYTIFQAAEEPGDLIGRFPRLIHREDEEFAYWISIGCQAALLVVYLILTPMLE